MTSQADKTRLESDNARLQLALGGSSEMTRVLEEDNSSVLAAVGSAETSATSLDTQEHPAPRLSDPPDPEWAYRYRDAVSEELREWPKRATALWNCGRAGILISCTNCGNRHLIPFRCGARTCPTCARRAAAKLADNIAARAAVHDLLMEVEPWDGIGSRQTRGWKFLTLTSRAPLDMDLRFNAFYLRKAVSQVRKAASIFWRLTAWGKQGRDADTGRKRARRDTSYIQAVEVAPGGMVHVHMAVYGEFVPQAQLQAFWSEALGETARVYVQAVRGPAEVAGALREVVKYATKGEKDQRTQARHSPAVELAFRGVKRISIGGALRNVRIDDNDGPHKDAHSKSSEETKRLTCETCGLVGGWLHEGYASPDVVRHNKGFGPVSGVLHRYLDLLSQGPTGRSRSVSVRGD